MGKYPVWQRKILKKRSRSGRPRGFKFCCWIHRDRSRGGFWNQLPTVTGSDFADPIHLRTFNQCISEHLVNDLMAVRETFGLRKWYKSSCRRLQSSVHIELSWNKQPLEAEAQEAK